MCKISIIIPVYNTEQYLVRCLDSVVHQTLREIEIICLNDGSTDHSLSVLKKYKESDSRFIIVDKENEGLGATRNYGVRKARGEYLMFLDSDDWIEKGACEKLYGFCKKGDLDILYAAFEKIWDDGSLKGNNFHQQYIANKVVSGVDFMNFGVPVLPYAWDKIWKRTFYINNELYNIEGVYYEDFPTTIKGFFFAERVMFLNYGFYNYYQNSDSITQISFKEAHLKGRLKQFDEIKQFADSVDFWKYDGFLSTLFQHIKMQLDLYANIGGTDDSKRKYKVFLNEARKQFREKLGFNRIRKTSIVYVIYFYLPFNLLITLHRGVMKIYQALPNVFIKRIKQLFT